MKFSTPLSQIAYAVDDVRSAAIQHSRLFGSGPFLLSEGFEVPCTLRGEQVTFTVDVAFGQWGDVQVELMHQTSPGAGLIHDLFPEGSGRTGLHHVLTLVDDLHEAVAAYEAEGYEAIFQCTLSGGTEAVFIDTSAELGHYIELYEYTDEMRDLFESVKAASIGFDGTDPVRGSDWGA